ncbi:YafY family protein [Cohnella sp. AR92]|uniref:helix-turn-helix transcriptional regulator n=1 Tax=Cohnella sp. AR92 TaxID=648716 RepID=UPI000F8DF234|nr:YafY family protein [Cohnella sp. AR92]RUS48314.1 YafY family transcriptional regulator [Cohnella sp. AR92]
MRADRLLSILLVLQTKGRATARELARQLEVSERTIQRDMDALCVSGIPLLAERGAGGGWSLPDGYRTRLTGLTSEEIQALLLLQSSSAVRELALEGPSSSALAKLLSALPAAKRSEAEIIRERLHIDLQGWHEPRALTPLLPIVQQAVWEGRALRIRYDSSMDSKRERDRTVFPWGLVAKRNTWYFVAAEEADSSAKELRTFRVSRLLEAELLSERFEVPSGFDLADWWGRSTASFKESLPWVPAVVRIGKEKWKRFSEERYVRVKSIANAEEEWIEAEVDFHTLDSAHDLLLGYGSSAIALQPPELREAIQITLAALVRTYKDLQTD